MTVLRHRRYRFTFLGWSMTRRCVCNKDVPLYIKDNTVIAIDINPFSKLTFALLIAEVQRSREMLVHLTGRVAGVVRKDYAAG